MTSIPFSFPTFPAWFRSPPSIAELSPRAVDWVSKCWSSSEIYCCYKVEESENVRQHAIRNLWSLCFGNMVVFCFSRCPAKGHPAHIRGYISIFLLFDFFRFPFWMNLKLEGVFELILANHESVIQLSFVMLWWNASFFKETIVLSVNRVYRDWCNFWSGRTHSSLSVFSALSQCPVPQKADNMNIGVVPQHFQWRNSWVIVGEVHSDFF